MSKLLTPGQGRIALQICALTAVAALMSGCSADSTRFGDAFGNPFATGSVAKPKKVASKAAPAGTGRTPPVTASALPPANHVASAAPVRTAPVAVSHETTGSIPSSKPVPGASFGGWTGQGGASVQVGAGDSAAVLAQRYGVPENVLLQTNGLHAASEVRPGTTIVIPIYNAVATAPGAARTAQAAPVRSEPVEPEERPAPAKAVPAHVAKAEPAEEAAPPARRPAAVPFKVEHASTLAERNAEAQRIVATQRAADKAAAEKLAAAQKAAEAQKQAEARKAAAAEKVAAEKAKADAATRKLASKAAAKPDPKAAAAAKAEAAKVAAAEKAAAAQKLAADRDAAKAKAEAAKTASAAAKAVKVAAAVPAKPAAVPAKAEPVAAVEKKVDATPTASVPPAAAPAQAPAAADGPEFRWPAHGRIIGAFKNGGNDGINIAVPEGTAVKAAEGGTVAYAGNELKGYGNMVLIRHPNGYVTAYANNGEIEVKKGDRVTRGQMIAKSGQSGDVSSPQLHFEVRKGSTPVDPTNLLAGT